MERQSICAVCVRNDSGAYNFLLLYFCNLLFARDEIFLPYSTCIASPAEAFQCEKYLIGSRAKQSQLRFDASATATKLPWFKFHEMWYARDNEFLILRQFTTLDARRKGRTVGQLNVSDDKNHLCPESFEKLYYLLMRILQFQIDVSRKYNKIKPWFCWHFTNCNFQMIVDQTPITFLHSHRSWGEFIFEGTRERDRLQLPNLILIL